MREAASPMDRPKSLGQVPVDVQYKVHSGKDCPIGVVDAALPCYLLPATSRVPNRPTIADSGVGGDAMTLDALKALGLITQSTQHGLFSSHRRHLGD